MKKSLKPIHQPHEWPEGKSPIVGDLCERLVGSIIPTLGELEPQRYLTNPDGLDEYINSKDIIRYAEMSLCTLQVSIFPSIVHLIYLNYLITSIELNM